MESSRRALSLVVACVVIAAAGCTAADEKTSETTLDPDLTTTESPGATTDVGAVDITGAILTSTDANCAAYVGDYESEVTDVSNANRFDGMLSITADGTSCSLVSNQIPNHDLSIGTEFANEAGEVSGTFTITSDPTLAAEPTDLGFTVHAVMLNGVIWEAYPAACFDEGPDPLGREAIGCGGDQLDHPWRYDVGSPDNPFRLDAFSAHAQPNGLYHYHSTPQALYEIDCTGIAESPVIGFARDGFPVYGPCFADEDGTIRAAQSSYELRDGERQDIAGYTTPFTVGNVVSDDYNGQFISDYIYRDGAGDLDACNGMTIDGQYGYYVTGGYPYVIACYSGTPATSFGSD